jgi:hypothetical protein
LRGLAQRRLQARDQPVLGQPLARGFFGRVGEQPDANPFQVRLALTEVACDAGILDGIAVAQGLFVVAQGGQALRQRILSNGMP